ncbi:MAG: AI-2E family transporter [Proteobacteria bacterium]|nr:AI-2E family transporter [Pseudomonadota bacterium]
MTDNTDISLPTKQEQPAQVRVRYGSLVFWHHLLVVLLVLLVGLYYGANLLIPLSVGALGFVLLTAIIDRIALWRPGGRQVPRWLAQILGLTIVLLGIGGIVGVLASQAYDVIAAVPRYQARFGQIIAQLVQFSGEDIAARISNELAGLNLAEPAGKLVGGAGSFLSGVFMVLLYIPFMMAERKPMNKKIPLAARTPEAAAEFNQVLQSISLGLQRYIGIKTSVSMVTGLSSYAIIKSVGLDFAETWGVLAFALNFIPTIGSMVAVAIPAIVALVQFEVLTPFLIILLGCGAVQFVVGNILEPSFTGKSLNLSPLMVILSLTFWTTIWGIPGALLSVPITVCVLIIFSNLPYTRPWAILMSGDGKLAAAAVAKVPEAPASRNKSKKKVG